MKAEIVSVGTELLLGQIADTNAAYLAGTLPALGIDCFFVSQVGDNLERLVDVLRRAWQRSDLVIMTGGLGPTEDDLTREAISALLDEPMVVQPDLETVLRDRFARLGRQMPESNIKQATLVASARVLPNPIGTAPGWWVERDGRHLVTMPGVPAEMKRMWEQEVLPALRRMTGGEVIVSRTLKVLGLGESHAEDRIKGLLSSTNPSIGTYAKRDGIHLRLTAKAGDEAAARAIIAPMEQKIRTILGQHIYGADDDTPQSVVLELLRQAGLTVATFEYATGGALAALLAEPAGHGRNYLGGYLAFSHQGLRALGVEDSVLPRDGVVTPDGVAALAGLARRRLGTDLGLALAGVLEPGAVDPQPVGSLLVGLDDGAAAPRTAAVNYATAASEMRRLGALAALNLLRLRLLGS